MSFFPAWHISAIKFALVSKTLFIKMLGVIIRILMLVFFIFSSSVFATDTVNPRIIAITANVKLDSYFLEGDLSGIILNDSLDNFTLILAVNNKIWFDDSFILSRKEKTLIKPHLIRLFKTATDKNDKAVLALFLKSILEA